MQLGMHRYIFWQASKSDFESPALVVLIIALYLCVPIFVNKWLTSDSPYRFEYRIVAFICFVVGVVLGYVV